VEVTATSNSPENPERNATTGVTEKTEKGRCEDKESSDEDLLS